MTLFKLPPEILQNIFNQIGSSFFQKDLSRLTISKQWFDYALPTCLKKITLSRTVLRLLASSDSKKQLYHLQNNLEYLSIELGGDITPVSYMNATADAELNAQHGRPSESVEDDMDTWKEDLNIELAQVAVLAEKSNRLQTLKIQVQHFALPESYNPVVQGYLSLGPMRVFLSLQHLNTLVLDIPTGFQETSDEEGEQGHICANIGSMLDKVETLHIRLRTICPAALTPPTEGSVRLKSLVVNLSLASNQPGITAASHARPCGSTGTGGFLQLYTDMQQQAEILATHMSEQKMVRILNHQLPSFKTQSLDILGGKRSILGESMAWDDDGKSIEEESSSEESEISDGSMSSFLENDND